MWGSQGSDADDDGVAKRGSIAATAVLVEDSEEESEGSPEGWRGAAAVVTGALFPPDALRSRPGPVSVSGFFTKP